MSTSPLGGATPGGTTIIQQPGPGTPAGQVEKVVAKETRPALFGDGVDAPRPEAQGDAGSTVQDRGPSSQLALRTERTGRGSGKRSKNIAEFKSAQVLGRGARAEHKAALDELMDAARKLEVAGGVANPEALPVALQIVTDRILAAMQASKMPKAEKTIDALKAAGLDELLIEGLMKGRVTHGAASRHLDRLRAALRTQSMQRAAAKDGIVAFDVIAQRLALAGGKGSPFQYSYHANPARDSLTTFASSLHR